jgi:hypothetical protein
MAGNPILGANLAGAPFGALSKRLGMKTRQAHHGSPHDFDEFSLSKIGTGEGAQAYGHGLYFSSSEDIARFYRDQLSAPSYVSGDAVSLGQNTYKMALDLGYQEGDEALDFVRRTLTEQAAKKDPAYPAAKRPYYDAVNNIEDIVNGYGGKLYTVEIPDEAHMLDWDKPLNEQSEAVQRAVQPLVDEMRGYKIVERKGMFSVDHNGVPGPAYRSREDAAKYIHDSQEADAALLKELGVGDDFAPGYELPEMTGQQLAIAMRRRIKDEADGKIDALNAEMSELAKDMSADEIGYRNYRSDAGREAAERYDDLMAQRSALIDSSQNPEAEVSRRLRAAGIPGSSYIGGESGARNFVVFDDEMINLVEKGLIDPKLLAPLAGVGAGAAALAPSADQVTQALETFQRKRLAGESMLEGAMTGVWNSIPGITADTLRQVSEVAGVGKPMEFWATLLEDAMGTMQVEESEGAELAQQQMLEDIAAGIESFGNETMTGRAIKEHLIPLYNELPEKYRAMLELL